MVTGLVGSVGGLWGAFFSGRWSAFSVWSSPALTYRLNLLHSPTLFVFTPLHFGLVGRLWSSSFSALIASGFGVKASSKQNLHFRRHSWLVLVLSACLGWLLSRCTLLVWVLISARLTLVLRVG